MLVILATLGFSALLGTVLLLLRLRAPLGADEGYLWYGVQRTLAGERPHRDFKSYEPGRYLWTAMYARLLGPGLLSVRIATHAFLACALWIALLRLHGSGVHWLAVLAIGALLACWAHPQHKQFEHGCLLLAWAASAAWLATMSPLDGFLAGAALGVCALFGFNLAIYAAAALLLGSAASLLGGGGSLHAAIVNGAWWLLPAGVAVGALPLLLSLADRAFFRSFVERRVASVLRRGSSNLPLPLPWPGRPLPRAFATQGRLRGRGWQAMFLCLLAIPLVSLPAWLLVDAPGGLQSAGLAAAALAATCWHHGLARCDPAHLAQVAAPMLLCCVLAAAALGTGPALALTMLLLSISAWLLWPWLRQAPMPPGTEPLDAGGLSIRGDSALARVLAELPGSAGRAGDTWLFAAPAWPAVYATLGLRSPAYDTFCLYPADPRAQQAMRESLQRHRVTVAVVDDWPVDGREELRFSRTHPQVWQWLHAHFDPRALPRVGRYAVLFERTEMSAKAVGAGPGDNADRTGG